MELKVKNGVIFRVQHSIVNHRSNAVRQILEVIQLAKLRLYIG